MNPRQWIADAVGDLIEALGAAGPADELWGGLDPRLDVSDRDPLTEAESPPDTDPERRLPAA